MVRDVTSMGVNGLGRLPDASGQMDGFGRLPDTREQVNGIGRLPSDGVERVAGGLGNLGAFGAATATPGPNPVQTPKPSSIVRTPDVAAQINKTASEASALAQKALALKAQAVMALKSNDRREAGIKAVQSMQLQRDADQKAQSAMRTQAVLSAERQAAALEQSANTILARAQAQVALTGETGATLAMRATASAQKEQAKRLRAQAATVLATKPAQIGPTNDRIAQVAAKFDVRTRRVQAISRQDDAILLATLQGVEEEGSGDLLSEESAADAYGADSLGRVLAAAEQRNIPAFISVLQGLDDASAAVRAAQPGPRSTSLSKPFSSTEMQAAAAELRKQTDTQVMAAFKEVRARPGPMNTRRRQTHALLMREARRRGLMARPARKTAPSNSFTVFGRRAPSARRFLPR